MSFREELSICVDAFMDGDKPKGKYEKLADSELPWLEYRENFITAIEKLVDGVRHEGFLEGCNLQKELLTPQEALERAVKCLVDEVLEVDKEPLIQALRKEFLKEGNEG